MFYFLQISANDDCPGNRTSYRESREAKTSTQINNKTKSLWFKFATDKLIEIKIHNFQRFTSFEPIQSHSWRGVACVMKQVSPRKSKHFRFKCHKFSNALHQTHLDTTAARWTIHSPRQSFLREQSFETSFAEGVKTWKNLRLLVLLQANRAFQFFQPAICYRWSFRHLSVPFLWTAKQVFFFKTELRRKPPTLNPYFLTPPLQSFKKHFLITWQIECSRAFQLVTGVSRYFSCGKSCKVSE